MVVITKPISLFQASVHPHKSPFTKICVERRRCNTVRVSSPAENPSGMAIAASKNDRTGDGESGLGLVSGSNVVRSFYRGLNGHDIDSLEALLAPNCVYEDLFFSQPFLRRKEFMKSVKTFMDSMSRDLQFVIDDMCEDNGSAVGVTYHLEWKGKPFPFSKGCSFFRLEISNGKRQITYARDIVESFLKPGNAIVAVVRGVALLMELFPDSP